MPDDTSPSPAEIEASGVETVTVGHNGVKYLVPAARRDAPMEVLEQFEDGNTVSALRVLLGPDQWAAFKATKPTIGDVHDLLNAWYAAIGLGSSGG